MVSSTQVTASCLTLALYQTGSLKYSTLVGCGGVWKVRSGTGVSVTSGGSGTTLEFSVAADPMPRVLWSLLFLDLVLVAKYLG